MTEYALTDSDGVVRWRGEISPAPGGSVPGSVRRLDLGVVALADLFEDVTLYTPGAGVRVGPFYISDPVYLDGNVLDAAIQIFSPDMDITGTPTIPPLASMDTDLIRDGVGNGLDAAEGKFVRTTTDVVTARVTSAINNELDVPSSIWEAARDYDPFAGIIGSDGHAWEADDGGGTSGGSEPDFAGNHGGTVADNDIVWTDKGAAVGSFHVYADVCVPAAP